MTDLRTGIIETANALGMDPLWLATIISYETGGTFNPMQPGPTTQFGQHRGLIQFGEPQARTHGVDFSSPEAALTSQLGPEGAIVDYYRRSGWQPGMEFVNAYATVNAGNPNRIHASDANNGGAPGTVLDKVNDQMAGHWQNALALMGGDMPMPSYSGSQGGGEAAYAAADPQMTATPQNALAGPYDRAGQMPYRRRTGFQLDAADFMRPTNALRFA